MSWKSFLGWQLVVFGGLWMAGIGWWLGTSASWRGLWQLAPAALVDASAGPHLDLIPLFPGAFAAVVGILFLLAARERAPLWEAWR